MPECERALEGFGLCRTHRREYELYRTPAVQAFVEERERRTQLDTEVDWNFLTDDLIEKIERGAWDAWRENSDLNHQDLEDLKQEAVLYAALHPAEIQAIESETLLRQQIKSRLIKANKKEWNQARKVGSLDEMDENREDDA